MSNVDFEVLPVGTLEELNALRLFAKKVGVVSESAVDPTSKWDRTRPLVKEIQDFYLVHNEKYSI